MMARRILFLVNHDVVIYNFRREMVERFICDGNEVHISSPRGEKINDLIALGAMYHPLKMDRHGMNPRDELRVFNEYERLMNDIKPSICLGFTIKPNVYGALAASNKGIPFVANITGLGSSIRNGWCMRFSVLMLYRLSLRGVQKVFFQNESDKDFMLRHHVVRGDYEVLPGSGVNLEQHSFEDYPAMTKECVFSTFGRIMRDKGIDELISAAEEVKDRGYRARFRIFGFFDDKRNYKEHVLEAVEKGLVEYIPQQRDVHPYMKESHAIIQPSHHEGLSNVLLEAEATGRPVIASDIPGCREAFDDGISGFRFEVGNSHSLADAVIRFIETPWEAKAKMGKEARRKVERQFDRGIVIDKYLAEVYKGDVN